MLFRVSQIICDSSISDSIAWNHTNFTCNILTLKDDIDIIFGGHSLIRGTVVTIFPEILGKCRSCVLLNEIAQKF